jgi:hypothetical protein
MSRWSIQQVGIPVGCTLLRGGTPATPNGASSQDV